MLGWLLSETTGVSLEGPGESPLPCLSPQAALQHGVIAGRRGFGSIFVVASGNGGQHSDNCNYDGYANSIYTVTIGEPGSSVSSFPSLEQQGHPKSTEPAQLGAGWMVGIHGKVSGNRHGSVWGVLGFSPQACSLLLTYRARGGQTNSCPCPGLPQGCDRHYHVQGVTWNAAFPSFVLEEKCIIHVSPEQKLCEGQRICVILSTVRDYFSWLPFL